jgi:hypothetical protein
LRQLTRPQRQGSRDEFTAPSKLLEVRALPRQRRQCVRCAPGCQLPLRA